MAIDQQVGTGNIRTSFYDKVIKQVTARKLKMLSIVQVMSTSAWINYFYRESQTVLSGKTGSSFKGIPRGAAFPQAVVEWERVTTYITKYGAEGNLHWEETISNDIDVQNRTLFRIGEGVAKQIDDDIYNGLIQSDTGTDIQTFNLAAGWNEASATIIDDLSRAQQLIEEADYDTDNLVLAVNPRDYRSIKKYLTDKGAQFPQISEQVTESGRVRKLMDLNIIVSRAVAASRAIVTIPGRCGTWKELAPLQTTSIVDPYKSVKVRCVAEGLFQLTDPKCVVKITNTQMSG